MIMRESYDIYDIQETQPTLQENQLNIAYHVFVIDEAVSLRHIVGCRIISSEICLAVTGKVCTWKYRDVSR